MFVVTILLACSGHEAPAASAAPPIDDGHAIAAIPAPGPGQEVAVFAGGCFWCLESDLDKLDGVVATTSGYAGGAVVDPTYDQVGGGGTGHYEVVRVVYDPAKVSFDALTDYFWRHIDPTDAGGQFCDRGDPYKTAIFPVDEAQRVAAEASKAKLDASGVLPGPIVTAVITGQPFYAAEAYHQDFHVTTPGRYQSYRLGCGRDAGVAAIWAKAP